MGGEAEYATAAIVGFFIRTVLHKRLEIRHVGV